MATVSSSQKPLDDEEDDGKERTCKRYSEIISTLPKEKGWTTEHMYQYQGFWYHSVVGLQGIMWVEEHFKPRHEDLLLVSAPKSGTTWFKSLMFAIMNRGQYDCSTHPLLTTSPHELVPFSEIFFHLNIPFPNPDTLSPPQIFHTHLPFTSLSQSVLDSQCRIVYVCRNPKDTFVSLFHFLQKKEEENPREPLSFEEAFEQFCKGVSVYGPFWDHVLGYWKASLEWPERVLFLKYEDMKVDSSFHLKRLAEFMGYAFSLEEEKQGLVKEILKLCSFENQSNLRVNKTGRFRVGHMSMENNPFFRKGEVGDWKNHLTTEMGDCLNRIMDQKLDGSGLTFHDSLET